MQNLDFLAKSTFIWFYDARKIHYTLHYCQFNSIFILFISLLLSKYKIRFCHDTQKEKKSRKLVSEKYPKIRENQYPRNTPKRHS